MQFTKVSFLILYALATACIGVAHAMVPNDPQAIINDIGINQIWRLDEAMEDETDQARRAKLDAYRDRLFEMKMRCSNFINNNNNNDDADNAYNIEIAYDDLVSQIDAYLANN